MASAGNTTGEFLMHYGSAMLGWQWIEEEMFHAFWMLNYRGRHDVAAAVYNSVIGFSTRLGMIDAAVAARYSGDERGDEWKKLSAEVRQAVKDRNILAHWAVQNEPEPRLARPKYFLRSRVHKDDRTFSVADIIAMEERFEDLVSRLFQFVESLDVDET